MVHKSLGNIACEKHPKWAEDACMECELDEATKIETREKEQEEEKAYLKELEVAGVSPGTGRMIGKFVGTKSEWKKKMERTEKNGGRHALMQFFSLPF